MHPFLPTHFQFGKCFGNMYLKIKIIFTLFAIFELGSTTPLRDLEDVIERSRNRVVCGNDVGPNGPSPSNSASPSTIIQIQDNHTATTPKKHLEV